MKEFLGILAYRFWVGLIAVLVLGSTIAVPSSVAQETSAPTTDVSTSEQREGYSLVIRPEDDVDGSYFSIEAEPGAIIEKAVVIGNGGDVPLELTVYAADAYTKVNGGFTAEDQSQPLDDIGEWIDLPTEHFSFEPGAGVVRTFSVSIPDDAQPGQYIAGLVLETSNPLPIEGSQFQQVLRRTIAVFVVVPGEMSADFSLEGLETVVSGAQTTIVVAVQNSENVLVKPEGDFVLEDDAGQIVFSTPIRMDSVYAGTRTTLEIPLGTSIPDGEYHASLILLDEASGKRAEVSQTTVSITGQARANAQFLLDGTVTMLPDTSSPIYAEAELTVTNRGDAVTSTEVAVDVIRNGEVVETFPLATSLALPQGETIVTQRYIPPAGFESGTWEFVVRLNVVDPNSGAATTVAVLDTIDPVLVP